MRLLQRNYRKRKNFLVFGKPYIGEEEIKEVEETIRSGWWGTGPRTEKFEKLFAEYVNSKYAVSVNSATAALHLCLKAINIKPGDEVITSPMTFVSTANVIVHCGATPIFADIDPNTWNIDPNQIEKKITRKTKAIIPVHLHGRPCDMNKIMKIARKHKLIVIEDAAHAIEAKYDNKKVGSIADLTAFSFYVTKNLATGEGGMVTTNNQKWADRIRMLRLHGLSLDAYKRYSVKHFTLYEAVEPGYKYNLTDLASAIGIHQLARIDQNHIRRNQIWQKYVTAFRNNPFLTLPADIEKNTRHAMHLFAILVDIKRLGIDRNEFVDRLIKLNIGSGVHFSAIHLHPYYRKNYGYKKGDFPTAEYVGERILSLPLGANLTDDEVTDVILAVRQVIEQIKPGEQPNPDHLSLWKELKKNNSYYHNYVKSFTKNIIPIHTSVLEYGSRGGELLNSLENKIKVGIEQDISLANHSKKIRTYNSIEELQAQGKEKFDYILLNHSLAIEDDIQNFVKKISKSTTPDTRIVVYFFNYYWKPFLLLAEKLGLMMPWRRDPNWLSEQDLNTIFDFENFEKVKSGGIMLLPFDIPIISHLINKYITRIPVIRSFCVTKFVVYRNKPKSQQYSVSVIIPARNEEGNMIGVLKKIPVLNKNTEVIFVEGNSTDNTFNAIKKEIKTYKGPIHASLYKQKGKGKGDAVRLGFSKAKNELLMILDADLTVPPQELFKFYDLLCSGKTDFAMGSRLVYPMESEAMRFFNVLGNHFFSLVFTFLLDQRVKDTLCGTKVLKKSDYEKVSQNRYLFGDFDPFGDFDLIFGAAKLNLKIVEVPVRYRNRTYGTTNISRFRHGILLLRMVLVAAQKLKFT